MTNLTQQALGESLKRLLQTRPLDRITIQEVADGAQVSRKTFYYHFHDIYDLVEWIFREDCNDLLQRWRTSGNWPHALASAFQFASENRSMMINIFQSMERVELERIVNEVLTPPLELLFDSVAGDAPVREEDRRFILTVFSGGLTGVFYTWVGGGMQEELEELQEKIEFFFGDGFELLVRRCIERQNSAQNQENR